MRDALSNALLIIYFKATLAILPMLSNSANVFYQCVDSPIESTSTFNFSCPSTAVIVVESAVIGTTDTNTTGNGKSTECSMTNIICTEVVTFPAKLCTGYNECYISQRLLLPNVSSFNCPSPNMLTEGANFINVNYSCMTTNLSTFGDICSFEQVIFSNNSMIISSYPNLPGGPTPTENFGCSCTVYPYNLPMTNTTVEIKVYLLRLLGLGMCSDQLTISLENNVIKKYCSPAVVMNDDLSVQLSSNITIKFEGRNSRVNAGTTRFLLELTARNGGMMGSVAKIVCRRNTHPLTNYTTTAQPSTEFATPNSRTSQTSVNGRNSTRQSSNENVTRATSTQTSSRSTETSLLHETTTTEQGPWNRVTNSSDDVAAHLPSGGIAGIVVGSAAAIALILVFTVIIVRKCQVRKSEDYDKTGLVRGAQRGGHYGGYGPGSAADAGRTEYNDREDYTYEQVAADNVTAAEMYPNTSFANGDVIVIDNPLYEGDCGDASIVPIDFEPEHKENDEQHPDQTSFDQRRSQTDSVYENARLKSHAPTYYNVLPGENATAQNQTAEEGSPNSASQSRDRKDGGFQNAGDFRNSGTILIDNTLYGCLQET